MGDEFLRVATVPGGVDETRPEVVSVQHVYAGYEGEDVLEDINLSVRQGDFVGLMGPNGGGKTTLLKVLLGLIEPTRGTVRLLGRSVQKARHLIGYVPQLVEFDREFPISARDVVRMGRLAHRTLFRHYTAEDDSIVDEALASVEMLDLRDRAIGELSGGQRQRIYIARALAGKPEVLLLDEPTANIDSRVSSSVFELLRDLNREVTIILISHDTAAMSSYVKTVGCLNRRLFYHGEQELTPDVLQLAYQCPVDLIAHGVPHRVFPVHGLDHSHGDGDQ